ncbi:MAG: GNAT family N-acetyltransferase [Rikenellaceae bacterium]|nr:GNAT family N-acetyltransferase [Rikenellaceae bacterium]
MNITFRPTLKEDIGRIMELVAAAQAWFRDRGIDQWQDGYPTAAVFEQDILRGNSYVGVVDDRVLLTGCLSFDGEPTYREIFEGGWLNEAPYGVVHRLVVDPACKGRGLAGAFLHFCYAEASRRGIKNIRIDTHLQNLPMQRLIARHGFLHCGRIVLESGADREAYQLMF